MEILEPLYHPRKQNRRTITLDHGGACRGIVHRGAVGARRKHILASSETHPRPPFRAKPRSAAFFPDRGRTLLQISTQMAFMWYSCSAPDSTPWPGATLPAFPERYSQMPN